MHVNLKTIFLCAGKISVDQHVGIIAVREATFSEPQREKYFEGLGFDVDEEFTGYQISVGDTLSHNTASLLLVRLHARVCNQRSARLYYAACGHVCKLCIYFKNYTI